MTLNNQEEDEVRKKVVSTFGEDSVKQMDLFYLELNDMRMGCQDSYEFLEKVKAKYSDQNTELLISAILYGMRQGELGYQYYLQRNGDGPTPSDRGYA